MIHTGKGVTCSDRSFTDLSTAKECSDATNYAKSFNSKANYSGFVTWSSYPKGCFIYDTGIMRFNLDSTGGRISSITSICKEGDT